jgi:acetyltransferase
MLMEAPARSPGTALALGRTGTGDAAERRARARTVADAALARGGGWLDEDEVEALLRAYGIPTVARRTVALGAEPGAPLPVQALEALDAAATELGWPVVLKLRSPDITHKSEVGGVVLGLGDADALHAAAAAMRARVREQRTEARLAGFTLQAMVSRPQAEELIVGASVDPSFGPVLLFGAGGTAVEVMADRAVGLPPLNEVLAREMVSRTRVARLLAGYRDRPPARVDAVCEVLVAVSQMQADLPELAELDLNPLLADAEGVLALDARVRIDRGAGAGAAHFAIRPYPDELEERVDWQGGRLLMRPIRPDDGPSHQAFAEQLTPEDLRLRFFQQRRELPLSEIARLTQIDYAREMAFIALADGDPATLGVARAVADPDNVEAEFAVTVRSDQQRRGLGRLLLDKLVRTCRAQGTQRLVGLVLPENRGMIALARSLGFEHDPAGSSRDGMRWVLRLDAGPAVPSPGLEPAQAPGPRPA